jgi:hypothetical protein
MVERIKHNKASSTEILLPESPDDMGHFTDWVNHPEYREDDIHAEQIIRSYGTQNRQGRFREFGEWGKHEMSILDTYGTSKMITTFGGGADLGRLEIIAPMLSNLFLATGSISAAATGFSNNIKELSSLIEPEIEKAFYITRLPENWDEEGGQQISPETFEAAANFLRSYDKYLIQNHAFVIPAPEIDPCKDGSIDISWHTDNARMLINIRRQSNGYLAFYYGDRYKDKEPIKGNVSVGKLSEFLAIWMKFLR